MWNQSGDSNELKKMNVSIIVTDEDTEQTVDNNKIDKSLSSGNNNNNQKSDFDSSGGVDSGFLSGPQLEESCEIDYNVDDEKIDNQIVINSQPNNSSTTIVSGAPVAANIESSFNRGYIDSGCIEDEEGDFDQPGRIDKGTITEESGKMILDTSNDNGLTELFCTLSLRSNQQLNNLNSTQQTVPSTLITSDKKSINTSTTSTENINKKWEIYYTQNNDGDTQLHLACVTGYVNVIAALIRMAPHPCLLDIQNDEAQSALHIATLTAQPLVIRMLLVAGAEPTLRDRNGNTPLHLACISGDLQCVKALTIPISSSELQEAQRLTTQTTNTPIKINNFNDRPIIQPEYFPCAQLPTDLEIRNYDGERCVHLAAQGSHIEVLRHLFFFGADINAREGKSGRTPLHISIEQCNEILANFLLEECQQKINLETVTYSGLTPYQFACILQNHKLQIDLEKFGAEPLTPPDSDTDGSDIESEFDDTQNYDRFGEQGYFITSHNGIHAINVA